jgi:hypothetical protein
MLSFFEEESAGDARNYVSLVAASRGLTAADALHFVIEKTMQAHYNVRDRILGPMILTSVSSIDF